ncbi:unnamed protein product [Cuscuta epithymum]|uniref:F-box domain-containing protein n=1 Tax=Cuscuta epithymum TaxID=186058 RepID=A0AAV0EHM2_9ASTE|nr:unnamed protein product [Cuscuta epithymum]CAH9123348.1 unnamed protein product [Cuscuta epithymum]
MGDKMETSDNGYDMPMEVLIEILIHLPVNSLIRFTIVCKSWLHLIRHNPQFALRHYLTRTRLPSSYTLMDNVDYIVDYFGKYGRSCTNTTDETLRMFIYNLTVKKTFRLVKKIEYGPRVDACVSNFCHGIMCAYVTSTNSGARVLLCNPAIGEVLPLPLPPNFATRETPKLGLGFDPINNNYKIVAAHPPSVFAGRDFWQVDVYSLRDGCWHNLNALGSLVEFSTLTSEATLNANGRVLNWLGHLKYSTMPVQGLLSFDMVDEVFQEVTMPECLYPNSWRQHHILSSSGCQACLCCSSFPSVDLKKDEHFNGIDIWVLNRDNDDDEKMLWHKHFSFTFSDDGLVWPVNIWLSNHELLLHVRKQEMRTEEVYHYDHLTHQLTRTSRFGTLMNADGYTESLISIKGLMPSSYHQYVDEGDEDEKDYVCFVREVGRKNNDVHWSYSFKLL